MRTVPFLALAVLIGVLAVPASAQNPPEATPIPVRGTVERLQGHTLMLKSRDGQNMTVALAANFAVLGMAKKSSDDIVTGDYVTAIGVRGPTANAKMQAVEIRIYPETMRGSREGTAPSNVPPGGVTANGTVGKITKASDGLILGLTYRGGGADYIVGPDVPVLASVPGDPTLLRPGAAVYAMASRKPDGSMTATQLIAEKDGIKPPFYGRSRALHRQVRGGVWSPYRGLALCRRNPCCAMPRALMVRVATG